MKNKTGQESGFTLIELIVVLAIITTLAAIFIPMALEKIDESSLARANSDVDALAVALTGFFAHVNNFPSCEAADCDPLDDTANNLRFLAVGTGVGDLSANYPASAVWDLANQDDGTPARNNAFNHLVQNDPGANGTANQAGTDYRTTRWNGPYISKLKEDPWGFTYIMHIGAMQRNGCPVTSTGAPPLCTAVAAGTQGWILSAGPNGSLDTTPTSTSIAGDDIGYIFTNQ
jgi:prepilin-type N-terminal cleavage/methylation domain-containing protein